MTCESSLLRSSSRARGGQQKGRRLPDGDNERVDVRYPDLDVARHWLAAGAGGYEPDRVEGHRAGIAGCVLAGAKKTLRALSVS